MTAEMIMLPEDTPEEWIPFDTVLCHNINHSKYLFLGMGAYSYIDMSGNVVSLGPEVVQLLYDLSRINDGRITVRMRWSHGSYLKDNYHIYDPVKCLTHS